MVSKFHMLMHYDPDVEKSRVFRPPDKVMSKALINAAVMFLPDT